MHLKWVCHYTEFQILAMPSSPCGTIWCIYFFKKSCLHLAALYRWTYWVCQLRDQQYRWYNKNGGKHLSLVILNSHWLWNFHLLYQLPHILNFLYKYQINVLFLNINNFFIPPLLKSSFHQEWLQELDPWCVHIYIIIKWGTVSWNLGVIWTGDILQNATNIFGH